MIITEYSELQNERKIGKNIYCAIITENSVIQLFDENKLNKMFILQIFLLIAIVVACTSAEETPVTKDRDCIQVGNRDGRDFTEHRCPLKWYVAGLQFVGHQNGESAYVVTCCQDI